MSSVWFRVDEAWDFLPAALTPPKIEVEAESRSLRFITSQKKIEMFAQKYQSSFRPFTLSGSGDFHHLSAVWLHQFREPFTLVSFDNHPDWDIRPPYWSCGAWINRALENPLVEQVSIWGCGNFECQFPGRLLGNRTAARTNRLRVHPWAQAERYPSWLYPMDKGNWQDHFLLEAKQFRSRKIYVTIDLDCLEISHAFTNWEQGRFSPDDLTWALDQLRLQAEIIGGDLCGAYSLPRHAHFFQNLASRFDHPKFSKPSSNHLLERNLAIFEHIWPALLG